MSSRSNGVTNDVLSRRRIVPGELVAPLLAVDDRGQIGARPVQELTQPAAALGHVGGRVLEEVEEPIVGRQQTEPHETGTVVGWMAALRTPRQIPAIDGPIVAP